MNPPRSTQDSYLSSLYIYAFTHSSPNSFTALTSVQRKRQERLVTFNKNSPQEEHWFGEFSYKTSHRFLVKMEVIIPHSDFDCQSSRFPPYLSAPSSPGRFNDCFLSAPASPARFSELYLEFEKFSMSPGGRDEADSAASSVPFGREDKPGTPKSPKSNINDPCDDDDELDFAFSVSKGPEIASLSAEELFDGGKIKPLKPPPRLLAGEFRSPISSPRSAFAQGKETIRKALSPRKKHHADPFVVAANNTRREVECDRGRDRFQSAASSSSSSRRAARSLSPYRVSDNIWNEEKSNSKQQVNNKLESMSNQKSTFPTFSAASKSSRKWRLRDLFLFRSASEGRATDKFQYRNYTALHKKAEDVRNSSSRSSNTPSSGSNSRRKGQVSAHELHYTTNKATSDDLKKRTYLPYKHGILGRLAFNPKLSFMN